jgi:hypothetical protein
MPRKSAVVDKQALRAEREKEIAKEQEKAQFLEEMRLLRPLRAFCVKEDTSTLDHLGLFRGPGLPGPGLRDGDDLSDDDSDEDGGGGGSAAVVGKKRPAAIMMLLSEVGILPVVFEFVSCTDIFRHRLWSRGMLRMIARMPLTLRVSKLEGLAMCVFLREASEDGGTYLFPFPHLKGLHLTSLSDRHVTNLAPAITQGALEKLSTLHVDFVPTEGLLGINLFFSTMQRRAPPRLRTLDLMGSYLGDEGFQQLANLFSSGCCDCVEHLLISQNGCSDRGVTKVLKAIAGPGCDVILKTLDLGRNNIGDDGARLLFKTLRQQPLRSLRTLNFRANQFGHAAVTAALVGSVAKRGCTTWRNLDLSQNPIGDQGLTPFFEAFAGNVAGCPYGLLTCALSGTELGDSTADALSEVLQSGMLQNLTALDLSFNWIHASGMRSIGAALTRHCVPRLKTLNLGNNHGGDEGIDHLSVALQLGGCRALQVLDISFNQGARCMQHLAMVIKKNCCPSLRELVVTGNAPPHIRPHRLFKGVPHLYTR